MFADLNKDNVLMYAIKSYEKINYVKSEFTEDYKAFRYIKRLLQRYVTIGELRENLILNHINIIYNVFGIEAGTRLMFFKADKTAYPALKTFLVFLKVIAKYESDFMSSRTSSGIETIRSGIFSASEVHLGFKSDAITSLISVRS